MLHGAARLGGSQRSQVRTAWCLEAAGDRRQQLPCTAGRASAICRRSRRLMTAHREVPCLQARQLVDHVVSALPLTRRRSVLTSSGTHGRWPWPRPPRSTRQRRRTYCRAEHDPACSRSSAPSGRGRWSWKYKESGRDRQISGYRSARRRASSQGARAHRVCLPLLLVCSWPVITSAHADAPGLAHARRGRARHGPSR